MWQEPDDGFEALLNQREADSFDGWEALQAQLSEDEEWAQHLYRQTYGQEY